MMSPRYAGWIVCMLLAMPAAFAQSEPYRLGPQDRLRIHVYEWPALTGEYAVGATGFVALPLIGEVKAAGAVPADLAATIADKLRVRSRLAQPPETVVDVIQYRPFYIVGGVDRPGEYNYRPDMMVLNAVSIAGGYYRPERGTDWGPQRDVITSVGEVRMADLRRLELKAREMRAQAEAEDLEEMPPAGLDVAEQLKPYLEEERRVFIARREAHLNQIKFLEEGISLGEREIQSLTAQIESAQVQYDSAARELNDIRQQVSRGISQATRLLPIERAVAQIEREKKELEAAILRTRQQMNLNARQIRELIDERKSTAMTDIQTAQSQLKEVEERAAAANLMIAGANSEPIAAEDSITHPDAVQVQYRIVRETDGRSQEIEATETTRVHPGDIIKVLRSQALKTRERGLSRPATTGSVDGAVGSN
jgi:exopolysaccharide production protein ExoF